MGDSDICIKRRFLSHRCAHRRVAATLSFDDGANVWCCTGLGNNVSLVHCHGHIFAPLKEDSNIRTRKYIVIYFATLGSYFLLFIPRGCGKQMGDEAQLFHVVTTSVKRYLLSGFSFCSASGRQPGRHQAPSYICGAEVLTPIPSLAKHISDRDRKGDLPHVRQIRHSTETS